MARIIRFLWCFLVLVILGFLINSHFYLKHDVNHALPDWKYSLDANNTGSIEQKSSNFHISIAHSMPSTTIPSTTMPGTTMPSTKNSLMYWLDQTKESVFSDRKMFPTIPSHYLFFEKDLGGFNNIRMSFEYMVVLAILTGRTLIFPPPGQWYLIDKGKITRGGTPGEISTFFHFFDMTHLQQIVPIMTTKKWMNTCRKQFDIPSKFFSLDLTIASNYHELKLWARKKFPIMDLNPEVVVFYYPHSSNTSVWGRKSMKLSKDFLHDRKAIDLPKVVWTAELIYFPCWVDYKNWGKPGIPNYRFLNQLSGIVAFGLDIQEKALKRLLRSSVHFRPEVFTIAGQIIKYMGRNKYDAIHIRRNELQYKESFLSAKDIISNVKVLLRNGGKLYIASDETDPDYFRLFEERYNVIRWADLWSIKTGKLLSGVDIPSKLIGLIEQVVCAGARLFIKTRHSTYSAYIVRLRGYMGAPNHYNYVHTHNYTANPDLDSYDPVLMGRDYMKEYRETWDIFR